MIDLKRFMHSSSVWVCVCVCACMHVLVRVRMYGPFTAICCSYIRSSDKFP